MKYAHSPNDIPTTPHYVILEFSSVYHEGDERSRTNPGHGYGAYSEDVCQYIWTLDKKEWEAEISRRSIGQYKTPFKGLYVSPAQISTKIEVKVEL